MEPETKQEKVVWRVHKFGGTSVADARCFEHVCAIFEQHPDEVVPVLRPHAYAVRLRRHEARGMCGTESAVAVLGQHAQGHSDFAQALEKEDMVQTDNKE